MAEWEKLNWQAFNDAAEKNFENLSRKPGVYAVRYVPKGRHKDVARVFGVDKCRILCFGMTTKDLRYGLRASGRTASGQRVSHGEGETYHRCDYNKRFPLDYLQFACKYCPAKKTKKKELDWFDEYEKIFGELPPLNRKRG